MVQDKSERKLTSGGDEASSNDDDVLLLDLPGKDQGCTRADRIDCGADHGVAMMAGYKEDVDWC
jgi:hypothetical protein